MDAAALRSQMWDRHEIVLQAPGKRTAMGVTPGPTLTVRGSINATARQIIDQHGNEVTAGATLRWHPDGPRPDVGWKVTLPELFGVKPDREVITCRVVDSGTGLTPSHVEVTVR